VGIADARSAHLAPLGARCRAVGPAGVLVTQPRADACDRRFLRRRWKRRRRKRKRTADSALELTAAALRKIGSDDAATPHSR